VVATIYSPQTLVPTSKEIESPDQAERRDHGTVRNPKKVRHSLIDNTSLQTLNQRREGIEEQHSCPSPEHFDVIKTPA